MTGIMHLHYDYSGKWNKIRMESEDGEIIIGVDDIFDIEKIHHSHP